MNTKLRNEIINLFTNQSPFKRSLSLSRVISSNRNLNIVVSRQFLPFKHRLTNLSITSFARQISTSKCHLNEVRQKMESQGDFRKPLEDWDEEFREKSFGKAKDGYLYNRISEFPKGEELIYQGPVQIKHQMRLVKTFSFASSLIGFSFQTKILGSLGESSMIFSCAALTFLGFFTYVTPFLIHMLTKRFVNELFYNPETKTYTAITYSFFLGRNETKFKLEDVEVPDVTGMFTTFVAKKDGKTIPMLVSDQGFHEYTHYGKIMGYDKPLDYMLSKSLQDGSNSDRNTKS